MARDLPEEIAKSALAPINRTAAQVTRKGTHWEPKVTAGEVFSLLPLPSRPVPSGTPDLTGRRFGRLVVVGLGPKRQGGTPAAWVVKCDCGSYSHRKRRVLGSGNGRHQMCLRCDQVEQLRIYSGNWPDREAKL